MSNGPAGNSAKSQLSQQLYTQGENTTEFILVTDNKTGSASERLKAIILSRGHEERW